MNYLRTSAFVIILLVICGCSPTVNPPGNTICKPRLEADHFVAADGAILPLRSWMPHTGKAKAALVALHGFNDYSNFFNAAGTFLSNNGIACYAYDQRGFGNAPGRGLWSGIDAYTSDLSSFVNEIRTLHPGIPVYILGESMGGAITIVAMAGKNPPNVDGIILDAPAVWGRRTMPWYQCLLLSVASHTVPWMKLTGKGLHISPSDNREMLRAFGRDPLVIKATRIDTVHGLTNLMDEALQQADKLRIPTLVQYGKKDQVIPQQPTIMMLNKMPASTTKAFYENGYHMLLRDLQGEKPLADIVAWLYDHNQALPNSKSSWN